MNHHHVCGGKGAVFTAWLFCWCLILLLCSVREAGRKVQTFPVLIFLYFQRFALLVLRLPPLPPSLPPRPLLACLLDSQATKRKEDGRRPERPESLRVLWRLSCEAAEEAARGLSAAPCTITRCHNREGVLKKWFHRPKTCFILAYSLFSWEINLLKIKGHHSRVSNIHQEIIILNVCWLGEDFLPIMSP